MEPHKRTRSVVALHFRRYTTVQPHAAFHKFGEFAIYLAWKAMCIYFQGGINCVDRKIVLNVHF